MSDNIKIFVAGVVTVALVAAFGLHSQGLTNLTRVGFRGSSNLLGTAEKG